MSTFDQSVCVVTGGASGIGLATASLFAAGGGTVVIADLADGNDIAHELGGMYVRTDTSDEDSVAALFGEVASAHGRVDVLVNNAGIMTEAEIDTVEPEVFRSHMDVNAYGVLLGIKHGARLMSEGAAIVNTASMAGRLGAGAYGSYAASKAAVISLTQVAAIEYGPRGVRVNCICPSSVETPMLQAQEAGDLEREMSRLASPLGVMLSAEQVAEVIGFLASPASSALTGQAINVDAGMSAGYSNQVLQALAAAIGA